MPMMPVHNYPAGYPYGVAHHGIGVPGISVAPSAARPRTSAPPKPALTAEEVYAIAESEGLTLLRAGGATGFKCAAHPGPASATPTRSLGGSRSWPQKAIQTKKEMRSVCGVQSYNTGGSRVGTTSTPA